VVFTCNHCPTAQYYQERIKQIVADYKIKGVAVVAIMPNDPKSVRLDELGWTDLSDTFAEMKIRARDSQFNFPYLYDGENEEVSRAYGPMAKPHVFVFDAELNLPYEYFSQNIDGYILPESCNWICTAGRLRQVF
jgi:AhpC/TSA family